MHKLMNIMLDPNGSTTRTRFEGLKSTKNEVELSSEIHELLKKTQSKINSVENEIKNVVSENNYQAEGSMKR